MPNSPVIEIENLRKFYKGKHRGVDGVDLEAREGEVFGHSLASTLWCTWQPMRVAKRVFKVY